MRKILVAFTLLIGIILPPNFLLQSSRAWQPQTNSREDAYRANNLGVALLEQFKYKEGADAFKRALQIDPKLALARINLAIALYNVPDLAAAQREAQAAIALAPNAPQPHYILGLIAKTQARADDAVAPFQQVLKFDPGDVGANVNLGQIYSQQRKYAEAIALFRTAVAAEPYNATALYNLGTTLIRSGQREEGQKVIAQFQELRQRGSGSTLGNNYLEQGRYADAVASTGAEPDLIDKKTPDVTFKDVTNEVLPKAGNWPFTDPLLEQSSGAVLLFDYDGDGDLDLLEVSSTAQRLYRNDGGKFTDVTAQSGDLAKTANGVGTAAVAGDYDNDGKPDLFILRYRASALYHNDGNGKFTDVTAKAKIPNYPYLSTSVAFVDYDHDGDLDLFIVGEGDIEQGLKANREATPSNSFPTTRVVWPPAPNLLLRNDGNGTFSDQTAAAKVANPSRAYAVVPTDFDNRRDIDLLVASQNGLSLFRNMRDGTFANVASDVGLKSEQQILTSAAIGDVNKDGFVDFYFGHGALAGEFALSDGRAHFQWKRGPDEQGVLQNPNGGKPNEASQLIDYDNDGLLDLVTVVIGNGDDGPIAQLRIWRNTGDGWVEVSDKAQGIASKIGAINHPLSGRRVLASGDIDGDGDIDIIFGIPGGGLRVARNEGGNRNRSVHVQLKGLVSNRSAVGSKVDLRAGSLQQKTEIYSASPAPASADLVFGLGNRPTADAVRIIWPSGIVQAETEFAKNTALPNLTTLAATELDRKPSSCPFLYTWNGERFEFVTDFMGGGEMGYLEEPGRHNKPDPVEYVRIRSDQLKERDGRYELRVTNELEETLYADKFQLIAVDHLSKNDIYPNEGMTDPPRAFRMFVTQDARPPITAVDNHGHDVLDRISKLDRTYPDDFKLDRIRGYAELHSLTMDFGKSQSIKKPVLLLTGWTDYAWSSDNVAASQGKKAMMLPALQVKDKGGRWRTVIEDIGIPVGRPQTVTVDMTGKFLSASREVRIVTNMRIYWDQILLADSVNSPIVRTLPMDPVQADLRWRGFSKEITPDGREPFGYDYQMVSFTSPWKVMTGRYTREGDVRELLNRSDDMFVIARPGDEISLTFDARSLPSLRTGWTRTFLLYSDGFSKEMDINSASPDQVYPLPFHGMSRYPYAKPEAYPLTPNRQAYIEKYNTRLVASPVTSIDCELLLRSLN